ncbi:MAG TPA: Ig-like domain-containing protein [Candidatus Dormibacteraeota bacterium]|nr:Ig-like domain-containing protein [Candidatus Dormibacteraeota bacterium]
MWDASPDAAGYRIYQGTTSRSYSSIVDAGNVTQLSPSNLTFGVTYYFTATAYDTNGVESDFSDEVSLIAGDTDTNPPVINLTSPEDLSSFQAPATIQLSASVTPNGHQITSVVFYNAQVALGEVANEPYSMIWSNVSQGTYGLSASVKYDGGLVVSSPYSRINVTSGPPPPPGVTLQLSMTANGEPVITGAGRVSYSYNIQTTTDFHSWTTLGTVTADNTGTFTYVDSAGTNFLARFYRAIDLNH